MAHTVLNWKESGNEWKAKPFVRGKKYDITYFFNYFKNDQNNCPNSAQSAKCVLSALLKLSTSRGLSYDQWSKPHSSPFSSVLGYLNRKHTAKPLWAVIENVPTYEMLSGLSLAYI